MTEEEAQSFWLQQSTNAAALGVITDQRGPAKRPLRIRVKTADMVNFVNHHDRKRKIVMEEKGLKKATEADLHRMAKRTMANHDKLGSGSADQSLADIAQGMVTGGGGEAFDNFNMNIQDIKQLLPDIQEAEEAPEEEAPEEEEEEAKKWFDRDRAVNKVSRGAAKQVNSLKDAHGKILTSLGAAIKYVEGLSASEQVPFAGELRIAQVRHTTLQKLLESSDKLQAHIASFKQAVHQAGMPSPSPKKKDGASDVSGGLGLSPPCAQYENLITIAEVEALLQEFSEVTRQDRAWRCVCDLKSQQGSLYLIFTYL